MEEFERPPWSGDGAAGTAVILPGASGGVFQSVIYWATLGLAEAGWDLRVATWHEQLDMEGQVAPVARDGLALFGGTGRAIVLGKSLGSLAAPLVSEAAVPAIWLTPLLDRPALKAAIMRSRTPTLVVGGTSDATWRRPPARDGLSVVELAQANHGLIVPGDWRSSLAATELVVESVVRFAAELD